MRGGLRLGFVALLFAAGAFAQATCTQITDTLYGSDGLPIANGTLHISASTTVNSGGSTVIPKPITVTLSAGVLNVCLIPNTYEVVYRTPGMMVKQWVVPSGGPFTVLSVEQDPATAVPSGSIALSQLSSGNATTGQALCWSGTAWGPGSCGAGGSGAVASVFGRTGSVTAHAGDYTAAQITNAVDSTGSYLNPAWLTGLSWSKLSGVPSQVTNAVDSTGSFLNPAWIASLSWSKLTSVPTLVNSFNTRTGAVVPTAGDYTCALVTNCVDSTGSFVNPAWIASLSWSKLTSVPTLVNSFNGRNGTLTPASGDYTCAQVTNCAALTNISASAPITFNQSTGVIACPTCSTTGGTTRQPTPFFSYWAASTGAATKGFSNPAAGCSNSSAQNLWPVAGYLAGPVVTTTTTNGQIGFRANLAQDCAYGSAPSPGGVVLAPAAAAGAYADTFAGDQWHIEQNGWFAIATAKVGSNTTATTAAVNVVGLAFTDDAGLYQTVMGGGDNGHVPTAASTTYMNLQGPQFTGTNEKLLAIPMPFAGTVGTFTLCAYNSMPSGGSQTYAISKSGTIQSTMLTEPSTDPIYSCYNVSPNVSFVAGDYLSIAITTPTTGGAISQWATAIYPTSGTASIVSAILNSTFGTTQIYVAPGAVQSSSSTATGAQAGMPISCLAHNFYVVQNGQGAGITTTMTIYKNGSPTTITGTIAANAAAGAIALDTTHSVQFNVGDTLSFSGVSTGGTSTQIGGMSIQCN